MVPRPQAVRTLNSSHIPGYLRAAQSPRRSAGVGDERPVALAGKVDDGGVENNEATKGSAMLYAWGRGRAEGGDGDVLDVRD